MDALSAGAAMPARQSCRSPSAAPVPGRARPARARPALTRPALTRPALAVAAALAGAAALAPAAAANPYCADLWFTRNALFDRAGYCFGSPLGQALFDNGDCRGKAVTLSADAQAKVAEIRRLEDRIGCDVDTSGTRLGFADYAIRRQMIDLPVLDELAAGCLGYRGAPIPLRAGHGAGAPVLGRIEPGDFVSFGHLPENGWSYVTTHGPNWQGLRAGGWMPVGSIPEAGCEAWAG